MLGSLELCEETLEHCRSALGESEARYRILLDHAPEAVVILDADAGCFIDANRNGKLDTGERSVFSNKRGVFVFDDLDAGDYVLGVLQRGHKKAQRFKVALKEQEKPAPLRLVVKGK